MAQPKTTDKLDCSTITSSPQLDDCVRKLLRNSNTVPSKTLGNFKKRTKQIYAGDLKLGNELIKKVQQAQHAWVTYRNLDCHVHAFEMAEGTAAYLTTVNHCIIRMNAERVKMLKKLL